MSSQCLEVKSLWPKAKQVPNTCASSLQQQSGFVISRFLTESLIACAVCWFTETNASIEIQWPEAISKQTTKDRICRVELSLRHTLLGISTC